MLLNLVVVIGLGISCAAGCNTRSAMNTSPEKAEIFVTDRVVEVRMVMKEGAWQSLQDKALDEEYVLADFWFDGELVPDVAVRPKGVASLQFVVEEGSTRLSLKVDFNLFNDARTFRGVKKLNFHNGFRDPTLMREHLAYELFRELGVPAPRTSFVDLWVNDTHLGLYIQVEQVDKTFLRHHFNKANGNLCKPIPPASYLNWTKGTLEEQRSEPQVTLETLTAISTQNEGHQTLREREEGTREAEEEESNKRFNYLDYMKFKTNIKRPNHEALFRFLEVLNNEPDETFPEEIEKVLDVDGALRFIAVSALVVNLDSYLGRGLNYYLYETDGRFTIIPWDLNESFGTYKCDIPKEGIIDFYIDEPTCGPVADRPLVARLLSNPEYRNTYHEYMEYLIDGPFSTAIMESKIDEAADLIRPFIKGDELKFYSIEEFEQNLSEDVDRFFGLKQFAAKRGESVRKQLSGDLPTKGNGNGNGGDPDKA